MSTNATIIERLDNGEFKGTSIHWDGYLSYAGYVLNKAYQNPTKVDKLINLGQISSLGTGLKPSKLVKNYGFDYYRSKKLHALPESTQNELINDDCSGKYTSAYHRDRHEDYVKPFIWKNVDALVKDLTSNGKHGYIDPIFNEYTYLYKNHNWYVLTSDDFGDTINKHLTVANAIKIKKSKDHRRQVAINRYKPIGYRKISNYLRTNLAVLQNDDIAHKRGMSRIYGYSQLYTLINNTYHFIDRTADGFQEDKAIVDTLDLFNRLHYVDEDVSIFTINRLPKLDHAHVENALQKGIAIVDKASKKTAVSA